MVEPGLTSGPTVGNSLINHASSSTAARTFGINCGQDSSSFSGNHRRDPPVSFKVVERIRRWEFVELANLLITQDIKSDEYSFVVDSDQPGYRAPSRGQGKLPVIDNIMTFLTAFSRFMTVILSTEATSKEEAAGLAAHQHVILQLYNDLEGNCWSKYDTEYRELAAAKGIRIWGELNLAIYSRCLPQAQPVQVQGLSDVTKKDPGIKEAPVCFQWNKGRCVRPLCSYCHACSECKVG